MLAIESYKRLSTDWPTAGRHILAQYDQDGVIVYQAFRPAIAVEALSLQRFGASFSRSRMSWIKPNFLWMMYRCGWATKPGQERVLAVRVRRPGRGAAEPVQVAAAGPHDELHDALVLEG